jgi:DNA (cytosine-5)-methyltransferase 1
VGGMASGVPPWLDGYWRVEPDIPRTARGIKDRVNRLRALGNSVVPKQAYPIFRAIMEIDGTGG